MRWLDAKADPGVAMKMLRYMHLRGVLFQKPLSAGLYSPGMQRIRLAAVRGTWNDVAHALVNNYFSINQGVEALRQLRNFIRNGELDFSTDDLETAALYASLENFFGWSLPPGHPRREAGPEDAEGPAGNADPGDG